MRETEITFSKAFQGLLKREKISFIVKNLQQRKIANNYAR